MTDLNNKGKSDGGKMIAFNKNMANGKKSVGSAKGMTMKSLSE